MRKKKVNKIVEDNPEAFLYISEQIAQGVHIADAVLNAELYSNLVTIDEILNIKEFF